MLSSVADTEKKKIGARVNSLRPVDKIKEGLQPYDFGFAANDYEWKTAGAQRLMYNLVEKDKFDRLKINGSLPDHVAAKATNSLENRADCTK